MSGRAWSDCGPPSGALDGVRVLDLSRILAGPYLTMMLGDLGADVVKVEPPGGDDTRTWGPPFHEGTTTYFLSVNRNKRSWSLDLTDVTQRAELLSLATTADIVVENFRPGVAERLGVGYEQLRELNPALVYCSINAFGNAPQARSLPGYDLLVQAVGGLMSVTGSTESGPTKTGVAVVDVLAGTHACAGVLAALRHAERTGEGQRVEVTLLQTVLSSLVNQGSAYLCTGHVPEAMGNAHPSLAPYETYAAADGSLVIAVGNDRQFAVLTTVLGAPELAQDPRFGTNPSRVEHRSELRVELEGRLGVLTVREACRVLTASGVPAGPVNDLAGAFELAEELGLRPVVDVGTSQHAVPVATSPLSLSATPVSYRRPPPSQGAVHQPRALRWDCGADPADRPATSSGPTA
ncbi:CaiB/BaiF CoA transferase family protein [Nocardioides allogilvus]|uniref:CaiB/BaiF CoA transferase family protein n=1 Tax=Nocardioides allogilvus TaxID=2072017 RepID=UPI000D3156CE|nr:CoA transferase [Nocardioides allogilvus]